MNLKMQTVLILTLSTCALDGCSTAGKCHEAGLVNPVFQRDSCKVRTRNVYIADQMSPEFKEKLRNNPAATVTWVGTTNENGTIVLGHFVISNTVRTTEK
jgi:hypothetical protein